MLVTERKYYFTFIEDVHRHSIHFALAVLQCTVMHGRKHNSTALEARTSRQDKTMVRNGYRQWCLYIRILVIH